jgi:beta-1,4-mannosyltransferase
VERLRLARFPAATGRNPYLPLLDEGLREFGVEYVEEPPLTTRWIWRARKRVDVLHFHWRPDKYYAWSRPIPKDLDEPPPRSQNLRSWLRLAGFAWRLTVARLLRYRLAWTIHEVYPPETQTRPPGSVSRRIDRLGSRLLARSCGLLLAHDPATAETARAEFGRVADRIEVVAHGSYVGVYPRGRPRAEVRRELGIAPDTFVFLCFGALRPDKAISLVLEAFLSIDDPGVALVVIGAIEDGPSAQAVRAAAAVDVRITAKLDRIPHDGVRELYEAADAAVLGRSEVWTSGSLILALSLGVPCIAARMPPNDELLAGGEAGWLFGPGDVRSLRKAMRQAAVSPALARAKREAALRQAERLPTWSEVGELTARLLFQSCNGTGER